VATSPSESVTDFTQSLVVPKFDPTLGNLRDVVLSYEDQSVISGTLMNTSAGTQHFTVTESTLFTLSLGSDPLLTNTMGASQTYTELAPYAMANFGTFTQGGGAGPMTLTSGEILANFVGTGGDVSFDFSTLTMTKVAGGGGNIVNDISTTAGATLTVEYDYDSFITTEIIPEPASVIQVVTGGFFIASARLIARRRRGRPGQGV
jgi:hypothetical protein